MQTIGQKVDSTASGVTDYVKEAATSAQDSLKSATPSTQTDTQTTFQKVSDTVSNAMGYPTKKTTGEAASDTAGNVYQTVRLRGNYERLNNSDIVCGYCCTLRSQQAPNCIDSICIQALNFIDSIWVQAKDGVASAMGYTEKAATDSANSVQAGAQSVSTGAQTKVNDAANYLDKATK